MALSVSVVLATTTALEVLAGDRHSVSTVGAF
jgi:hypothetical protein